MRIEFASIGEHFLTRGGYRRSHFQADQLTLQNVLAILRSRRLYQNSEVRKLPMMDEGESELCKSEGELRFWWRNTKKASSFDKAPPFDWYIKEQVLQAAIKRKVSDLYLKEILTWFNGNLNPGDFEILGENALSHGYSDILIKEAFPKSVDAKSIVLEIKLKEAKDKDLLQIQKYTEQLKSLGGVFVAREFSVKSKVQPQIRFLQYSFRNGNSYFDGDSHFKGFDGLVEELQLEEWKQK